VSALSHDSVGFLLLKTHAVGVSVADTVRPYTLFNAVCAVAASLVGRLGDAVARSRVLPLGYGLYGAINLALVWASHSGQVIALFALYGVYFAIDEWQSKSVIADLEPERRATAVGAYNFVTGVLYLPASLAADALWAVDLRWAFALAASLAATAIALLRWMRPAATSP